MPAQVDELAAGRLRLYGCDLTKPMLIPPLIIEHGDMEEEVLYVEHPPCYLWRRRVFPLLPRFRSISDLVSCTIILILSLVAAGVLGYAICNIQWRRHIREA